MITKDDIQDLKDTAKRFVEERNSLRKENTELKAYMDVNEDFKTAWEELKAENERLKEELATYGATGVCEVCSDKANKLADKYLGCLQEIKEIADDREIFCENCSFCCDEYTCDDCGYVKILEKITKAEEE